MANTLTSLVPTLFSAAQEVSNEPFGVLASVTTNWDDKGVAKGDEVTVPVAPTRAATDFSPAAATTAGDDAIASSVKVKITQSKKVSWNLTGEQIRSLENGADYQEWVRQLILQGMRTLRNLAEADACLQIKSGASRAYGTAGTSPFASDINAIPEIRKILFDNGAPMSDLQLCIDSTAGTSARKLGVIQQAYQAGSDAERRSGDLLRQFGFRITESAGIQAHTKGTGASYVLNGAHALGAQSLTVKTGTGTVLAGDIITLGSDTNKYVANGDPASSLIAAPGSFNVGRPGIKLAEADGASFTIGNNYTPNLAFERSAVVSVLRPPVIPDNPTIKQQLISDKTGLTYLLLDIAQYGMRTWELHLAYGTKVVQGEHVAVLIG